MKPFELNNKSHRQSISYALSNCYYEPRRYIIWEQQTRQKNNLSKLRNVLETEYHDCNYNEMVEFLSKISYRSLNGQTWILRYDEVFNNY